MNETGQSPPRAVVFDDGFGRLGPMTDLRAAFDVRTGALTNLERLRAVLAEVLGIRVAALVCDAAVAGITRERTDLPVNPESLARIPATVKLELAGAGAARSPLDGATPDSAARDASLLLVNGRCVLPPLDCAELRVGEAVVEERSDSVHVVAVHLSPADADAFVASGFVLPQGVSARGLGESIMIDHPWDVIGFRDQAVEADLAILASKPGADTPPGVTVLGSHTVRISPTATLMPGSIIDASAGAVFIDDDAVVRPGAILIGPCSLGVKSQALERATVRGNTAIGPVCKVNGEVSGIIMQGFANKAHDGFLGDCWIGEWVNLGAGTTGSNLLNTYGEVTAQSEPSGRRSRTGLTFFGGAIGDHVKTAIETTLMTGTIIGTGSMLATPGYPPTTVGRFRWLTPAGERAYRIDKFLDVARAAMGRRGLEPSAPYIDRLRSLAESEVAKDGGSA